MKDVSIATIDRSDIGEATSMTHAEGTSRQPRDDRVGKHIGNFVLEKEIGTGGMGTVFKAIQFRPVHRAVALKMIRPEAIGPGSVERFLAEQQTLARMDHADIATLLDAGTDDGRPYFAMEFADGEQLDTFCENRKLDLTSRIQLAIRLARAIEHAHERGVLHRDIKPANVIVSGSDERPTMKVIDFGVAKDMHRSIDANHTQEGEVLGTPNYMAPEQVVGGVDARSDVFSIGATLFRLITGKNAFCIPENAGLAEILAVVKERQAVEPARLLRQLSKDHQRSRANELGVSERTLFRALEGDLGAIVMQALAADRTQRYATASDLASDLERYLANQPVSAARPSVTYRLEKFLRRHRAAAVTSAIATAVIFALVFAIGYRNYQASLASDRLAVAAETEVTAYFAAADEAIETNYRSRATWEQGLARAAQLQTRIDDRLKTVSIEDARFLTYRTRAIRLQDEISSQRAAAEAVDALNRARDGGTGSTAFGVSIGATDNVASLTAIRHELSKIGVFLPGEGIAGTDPDAAAARFELIPDVFRGDLIDTLEFIVTASPIGTGVEVDTGESGVWISSWPNEAPLEIPRGSLLLGVATHHDRDYRDTRDMPATLVNQLLTGPPGSAVRVAVRTTYGVEHQTTVTNGGQVAYWAAEVLKTLDPDIARTRQREAILKRDAATLVDLAGRPDIASERPFTLIQLAESLPAEENALSLKLLRAARSAHPSDYWTNIALGKALPAVPGGSNDALRFLTAAAAIRPDSAAANTLLAMSLMMTPMQESALEQLRHAVKIAPANTQLRYMLAQYLRFRGDYAESIRHYDRLLADEGETASTLSEMAHAYGRLNRVDEQIASYERAIAVADGEATCRYRLLKVLRDHGFAEQADQQSQLVLGDLPPDYESLALIDSFHEGGASGSLEIAPLEMKRLVDAGPTPFQWHRLHGFSFMHTGDAWAAIGAFQEALLLHPQDEQVKTWLKECENTVAERGG